MKISAVVLTKNEEKNIEDCLKTLGSLDEIIIVDDFSTDKTIEIAESLKDERVKIFKRSLNGDFSEQRNFALDKARNDFIFFVDADERVSIELNEELKLIDDRFEGYSIQRIDTIWGKQLKYGETGSIYLLRIGNKKNGKWEGRVHEEWKIRGKTRKLRNPLVHFPHQTIAEFLEEVNFYTDLRSQELFSRGIKSSFISIIIYPKTKFFLNFILKQGFRDGIPGFIFAILMSFHSFMVRGKLWYLWQSKK